MALDLKVAVDALKDGTSRNLRQLFWLHFVQSAAVYAAFGDKLAGRDALECLKHSRRKFGMVVQSFLKRLLG